MAHNLAIGLDAAQKLGGGLNLICFFRDCVAKRIAQLQEIADVEFTAINVFDMGF